MNLPFKLNPSAKASYTEQLADAIRDAIRKGRYQAGERLPSWDEMAAALGVSRRIPRDAMKILAREGCVISRPRIGTVVGRVAERRTWKAPVLYVRYEVDAVSYCSCACLDVFRRRPRKKRGGFDFKVIEGIKSFGRSLVVNNCFHREICEWCGGLGVSVVDANGMSVGEYETALGDFLSHCRRKGIRRIMEVTFASPASVRLPSSFARAGIKVEGWMIPPLAGSPRLESIRNAAQRAFAQRFRQEGRSWLPDLFFFVDDYLAAGAFLALSATGVRIPEDVKVVTLANEGNVPVWNGSCATLLMRQSVRGERLAAAAIERLTGRAVRRPEAAVPLVEYVPGDTFPA